ncbi:hypothetical protein [Streptomyces jumonjinensis]|uniref:hypothetical protein n=1 Tax=Streptomyces jumonjinensis TaxID=1945 RepID=UPI00378CABDC
MPWVRLDDRFPSHRKVALLSDRAFRLYVSALCWASENLTEGRILDRELTVVARLRGIKAAAKELEGAGLWDRVEGGWEIHDFLEYNPDRARIQAERAANAARQKAWRERKRAEREARKAAEEIARDAQSNAPRNGVTDDTPDAGNDASATRQRHDNDTILHGSRSENQSSPQVTELRNGVNNGTPVPCPYPSTSYGSTAAADEQQQSGLPDALSGLKRAIAEAGFQGIGWDLRDSQREYTRQAIERAGISAMVAFAVSSARLKGQPATAAAWVQGWRSLEAPPENDGVSYLPARLGPTGPANRQQQETDEMFDRAMARARARMQQKESS